MQTSIAIRIKKTGRIFAIPLIIEVSLSKLK